MRFAGVVQTGKKNNRVIVTNQQTIVRKDCIKQENQAAFYLTIIE